MNFLWPAAVAIESTRDDVVAGYAPRFVPEWTEIGSVAWQEGGHERIFLIKEVLEDEPNLLRFKDQDGEEHALRTMTLGLYEDQVKPRTMGKPTFRSLTELLETMQR